MKAKMLVFVFLVYFSFWTQAIPLSANNENLSLLTETSLNHTTKQIEGKKPIVIHTQLKHYDQPTLKEYQECHENLEKCQKVCEGVEHRKRCVQECPVCPLLIKEKIFVQGINDTNFSQTATASLNTTNIIRLTNEIRNIIETNQGNISNINENIVHVHQNISRVGGKFGLGFNNTEPCCIILSSSKSCETKQANRCHRKRHRVCGSNCKSRVMMAKLITVCEKTLPDLLNEELSEENCHETVKYVPHQSRRKENVRSAKRCSFSPSWPYVSCSQNGVNYARLICKRCLGIPYFYILRKGIPPHCSRCFMTYASPITEVYSPSSYSAFTTDMENDYLFEDKTNMGSWQQDRIKCKLPDGTISDECAVVGSDLPPSNSDPFKILPEAHDEYMEYDTSNYEDNFVPGFEEILRRRRHTFPRSKYSHRNK